MSTSTAKRARVLVPVSEEDFQSIGGAIMGRDPEGKSHTVFMRRWLSFFGVEPVVCVDAWTRLRVLVNDPDDPELAYAKPEHLLWGLLFLKKYGSEEEMSRIAGADAHAVDEKTFRKWSKIFVERLSFLLFDVVRGREVWCCFYSFPSNFSLFSLSHFW